MESPQGRPLIFLVPEQATYQTELALAATPGLGGIMRAQVLSFRRLAWRVLHEAGGAARVHIGDLGKRMVLRDFLEKHKAELKVFHRAAEQPGFADSLAGAISELKLYCISPAELLSGIKLLQDGQQESLLVDKLHDLNLLYSELESYLAGRYTDPDDYLNLLVERLDKSPTVCGSEIWLDGFAGFTPQEYKVIGKLLTVAESVNIALCLDSRSSSLPLEENDLYYPTRETCEKLKNLAFELGIKLEAPQELDQQVPYRLSGAPDIAHLEDKFFKRPTVPYAGVVSGVKLVAGVNRRAEVEAAAREITRLCRDRGCHWRDIAVVLRDVETYHLLISTIFSDHGIPFFIDRKRQVMHHPLVELIRSALEVAAGGWTCDPIFRYLKTDLTPVSRDEVDLLENYVLACGIRGKKWIDEKDWNFRRRYTLDEEEQPSRRELNELDEINRIRRKAVKELVQFARTVKQAPDVRGVTTAIYVLLEALNVPGQLEKWSREAEAGGRLEEAREHIQIWGSVLELLEQVVEALGDSALGLKSYARVMDTGLESLRLGLIPPGLDQVLVGSLERSRNPNVKAAFVLGVSDGVLPARTNEDGIFNDMERQRLEEAGLQLAPGGRRRLFDENFLVYIALTRSSEYLWVSYPLSDDEGRTITPSVVVNRLKELLPGLTEKVCSVEPSGAEDDQEFVTHPDRCLSYLAGRLREARQGLTIHPVWWDVYNWFIEQDLLREKAVMVLAGLFYVNQEKRLAKKTSRALYGQPLKASVSRIERFKSCPFAHFLSHGLKLKERPVFKLGAPDLGQFFHAALKKFAERLEDAQTDWGSLARRDCARLAGQVVDELAPRLQNEILLSSARYRFLTRKLKRTVERAATVLAEHARRGRFRPAGLELDFGVGAALPPLVFNLGQGIMELSGRIDRVDLARAETGSYLRVIDYKSGTAGISLSDIYHGLGLQLLVYLDVVLAHAEILAGEECQPGGMLYFSVHDPLVKSEVPLSPQVVEDKILKALKMKGMVLADEAVVKMMDDSIRGHSDLVPVGIKKDGGFHSRSAVLDSEQFQLLRTYLRRLLVSAGTEISTGKVDIEPYSKGGSRACRFCPYGPVCQFDQLIDGNSFSFIGNETAEEIWRKIRQMINSSAGPKDGAE